ncbi:MAG: glutamate-1-semialdehyde 2,1-aminomutase [Thermaerobacter sp.]|nr:glutamate-1-semialdehyde 2,1-aminomutase [Thermaerobacter sp.]
MADTGSERWFARATKVIAGGVNSPARSFRGVGGDPPVVMKRGQGAYLFDVDGRRYIDYLAAFGPLVLGHAHPEVIAAVRSTAGEGSLLGTPCPLEIELAEELVRAVPGLEQVRLTTTGTEAVMSSIRLARAFTGRSLIIKFEGAYHGHSDGVLVRAGSGASSIGTADSLGVPTGVTGDVISLPFNDGQAVRRVFEEAGNRVAAILTEPVVGNMGIVLPQPGFLQDLAALAKKAGALLIFDEVITAFRFHYGPVATQLGVIPDLYALGKIIGGGLPAGAYGGRAEIMRSVAPLGGMFQAGTLAGNPLSSAAGLATLRVLREEQPYDRMDRFAEALAGGIEERAHSQGIAATVNRLGSGFTLFFGETPVTDYTTAQAADAGRFGRFHQLMLSRGVYLAPSRYEAWFVSAAHGQDDLAKTLDAVDWSLRALKTAG